MGGWGGFFRSSSRPVRDRTLRGITCRFASYARFCGFWNLMIIMVVMMLMVYVLMKIEVF